MGVDYTAFVCWGKRIKHRRNLIDDLEKNSSALAKHRVGFAEYGSRSYGGDGGVMLLLDETHGDVDVKHDPDAKPLPRDRDWDQVSGVRRIQDALYDLRQAGVVIEDEGECGWFICGHVW